MSHQPTSVLQALDPRGRCNRKGLLLAAGVLLTAQAAIALLIVGHRARPHQRHRHGR
jgi:hypothetical protein